MRSKPVAVYGADVVPELILRLVLIVFYLQDWVRGIDVGGLSAEFVGDAAIFSVLCVVNPVATRFDHNTICIVYGIGMADGPEVDGEGAIVVDCRFATLDDG